MRESPYPMIPVEEALARVLANVSPLQAIERRFDEAQGWVLAEDITAADPLPPFPAATVDGFAVVATDGAAEREVVGEQFAGYDAELRVQPGQAARITTGAPVPEGADAVMMIEWSREENGRIRFTRSVNPGDFIRPVGSDIEQGQVILTRGSRLGAPEIGLLATVGATTVRVHKRPVVGVMSTGDELVEPNQQPGAGQIRDSNRFSLMAAVRAAGAEAFDLGIAPDTYDKLLTFVEGGLERCDALLTSGGVSMGELDLVKPLLEELGIVHFGRVNTKPGKPVTFGTLTDKPFFAMPGNPVSSLVSFEVFVRPALRKMMGFPEGGWFRPRVPTTLEHHTRHTADRTEFQRAILRFDPSESRFYARTTGSQQSSRLLSMVGANALIVLPQGKADFEAGEEVEALVVGDIEVRPEGTSTTT
ncbi:MAG: molybdopterin molybdotransferase MoeA [Chloroflexota bacterium]|nr:molybdopterin molybdotransferase MoeA [Chloroflexota bacterium]